MILFARWSTNTDRVAIGRPLPRVLKHLAQMATLIIERPILRVMRAEGWTRAGADPQECSIRGYTHHRHRIRRYTSRENWQGSAMVVIMKKERGYLICMETPTILINGRTLPSRPSTLAPPIHWDSGQHLVPPVTFLLCFRRQHAPDPPTLAYLYHPLVRCIRTDNGLPAPQTNTLSRHCSNRACKPSPTLGRHTTTGPPFRRELAVITKSRNARTTARLMAEMSLAE